MKINIISFAILFVLLLMNNPGFGQLSDENWDLMLIRNDRVYPSKTAEYETALMDLKNLLTEKNVDGFYYFTHMQDDYFFTHVTPIHKLEDLSRGIHSFMAKEVNDPELDLIMDYISETIASYSYYIVRYHPDLSFVPEGDDWGEGSPYRRWSYYYFQPGTEDEVEKVLASWKQLYADKGIDKGFRVFSGFLGVDQPLYILTTWAENPLDFHQKLQDASGQLGEQGAALWAKMMEYVAEVKTIEGWLLPQYSYAPGMKMAE